MSNYFLYRKLIQTHRHIVSTKLKEKIHKRGPESSRTPSISRSIRTYFSPGLILINILKILQKAKVAILVYNSSGITFKLCSVCFFIYFIVCLSILICATLDQKKMKWSAVEKGFYILSTSTKIISFIILKTLLYKHTFK